jgi:hypothetical protein
MNTETIAAGATTLTLLTPGPVLQFVDADGNKQSLTGPAMRKLFEVIRDGSGTPSATTQVDA